MKITLVLLQSIDGYIAKNDKDDLSWGSKEDKKFFYSKANHAGVMIMGSKTFQLMPKKSFANKYTLVLTSKPEKYEDYENEYGEVEFFSGTPEEAVQYLEEIGYSEAVLAGGGSVYGSFLHQGLVDEMYVTIAPKIFGTGIKGYGMEELNVDLDLLEIEKLGTNEVVLHYQRSV